MNKNILANAGFKNLVSRPASARIRLFDKLHFVFAAETEYVYLRLVIA
jgi:hypothetical protein